jgi:hypothetical protein
MEHPQSAVLAFKWEIDDDKAGMKEIPLNP